MTVTGIYLPFFQPSRITMFGSDYAMLPMNQAQVDAAIDEGAASAVEARRQRDLLKNGFGRSGQTDLVDAGFGAFAPEADLSKPQGALRFNARLPGIEVGLTLGSALEKVPALVFSQSALDYMEDDSPENRFQFLGDPSPFDVRFNRSDKFTFNDVPQVDLSVAVTYGDARPV